METSEGRADGTEAEEGPEWKQAREGPDGTEAEEGPDGAEADELADDRADCADLRLPEKALESHVSRRGGCSYHCRKSLGHFLTKQIDQTFGQKSTKSFGQKTTLSHTGVWSNIGPIWCTSTKPVWSLFD